MRTGFTTFVWSLGLQSDMTGNCQVNLFQNVLIEDNNRQILHFFGIWGLGISMQHLLFLVEKFVG